MNNLFEDVSQTVKQYKYFQMHLQLILQIEKKNWLSVQMKAPKFYSLIKTSGVLLFQDSGVFA